MEHHNRSFTRATTICSPETAPSSEASTGFSMTFRLLALAFLAFLVNEMTQKYTVNSLVGSHMVWWAWPVSWIPMAVQGPSELPMFSQRGLFCSELRSIAAVAFADCSKGRKRRPQRHREFRPPKKKNLTDGKTSEHRVIQKKICRCIK